MSKKVKKKLKKAGKKESSNNLDAQPEISALTQKIKKLEKQLGKRDKLIDALQEQLKKGGSGKSKKGKPSKQSSKPLFRGQTKRVGVMQQQARQRHGYLRHRYEYYLTVDQDKNAARALADQDLREKFGDDSGYTQEELELILS
jgi:predicted RNase H-like nuclease (RuvC/YqgF family)